VSRLKKSLDGFGILIFLKIQLSVNRHFIISDWEEIEGNGRMKGSIKTLTSPCKLYIENSRKSIREDSLL
jgi:hypothetical protein